MQAAESRAAPTLLAGLLQGESIKIRLNYNDSSENLVVFGERIQGPTVKGSEIHIVSVRDHRELVIQQDYMRTDPSIFIPNTAVFLNLCSSTLACFDSSVWYVPILDCFGSVLFFVNSAA